MKNTIFILFVLIFLSGKTVYAQQERMGRKTAEQRTELMTKNLSEKLAMTPEQTVYAREVILKREKFRDAGKLSKEKQKEIHADLNKILTKDQQQKWNQMKKEDKNKNDGLD